MLINIIISVILVIKYGIVGVAIGTLVSMAYRTVYLAWYLKGNIINRKLSFFVKHIGVDVFTSVAIFLATSFIKISSLNYLQWFFMALKVGIIGLAICILVNYIVYREQGTRFVNKIGRRFRK